VFSFALFPPLFFSSAPTCDFLVLIAVLKWGCKSRFSFGITALYRPARIWRNCGLMACASARSVAPPRVGYPTLGDPAERAATKPEFVPKRSPYFTGGCADPILGVIACSCVLVTISSIQQPMWQSVSHFVTPWCKSRQLCPGRHARGQSQEGGFIHDND
jgi:hypothetical protein